MKAFLGLICVLLINVGNSVSIPIFEHDLIDELLYQPEMMEAYIVPINAFLATPAQKPLRKETMPAEIGESKQFGVYRPIVFRPWKWPSRLNAPLNPLYGLRNPYYQSSGTPSQRPGVSYSNYQSIYGATSIYDIGGFYG